MLRTLSFAIFCSILLSVSAANAHSLILHPVWEPDWEKVEFYLTGTKVYESFSQMTRVWHQANAELERGVITEFQSKLDPKVKVDPAAFRTALGGLKELHGLMQDHHGALEALLKVDANCAKQPILVRTLAGILEEGRPFPRLAQTGVRYADAAGVATQKVSPIRTQRDILTALRADLKILATSLEEVVSGLQDAMPLVEKGEFSAVMLSGRNAFGDKMPQFTDMFSAYHRFYVQTVLASITATMQAYPAGYEWLTKPRAAGGE